MFGATAALLAVVVAVVVLVNSRPSPAGRPRAVARAPARPTVADRRSSRAAEPPLGPSSALQRASERPRGAARPASAARPVAAPSGDPRPALREPDAPEAPRSDPASDAAARAQFDAAFEAEPRDDAWATATESAITAVLGGTEDALPVDVSCRATLCRVELPGGRVALPSVPPLDGVAWWIGDREGSATLLLVRDDADIPLPTDPDA